MPGGSAGHWATTPGRPSRTSTTTPATACGRWPRTTPNPTPNKRLQWTTSSRVGTVTPPSPPCLCLDPDTTPVGRAGGRGPKGPSKGPGSGRPNSDDSLRDGANRDGVGSSKPAGGRCKGGDPIDLVSGEMVLTETDVRLPGLLDLVIERTHLSSYRCGQWFGSSWASTLDQRLEADERGLVLATADDGMLLSYDVPAPDTPALPHHGPRRELRWDGTPAGEIQVTDRGTGHTLHFLPASVTPAEAAAGRVTLPLEALSDRNGHRVDIWRDDDGTPFEIRHSGGYRIAVDTDGDRVVALRLLGTEDGDAGTVLRRYSYDDGRLAAVTDALGHTWDYAYNEVGRLVRESDFQGRTVEYRPDPTGELAARTNAAGCTTVFVRDELGRTIEEHSADGIATFVRDPAGCLLRSANDTTTVTQTYDVLGRKLSEDVNGRTTSWTYDALGQRTSRRTPSGVLSTWSYDAAGRPEALDVGGDRVSFTFDDADREVRRLIGPGLVLSQEWDIAGRLSSQAVTLGAGTLQQRAYTYRADGHLSGITDSAGGTRRFELDPDGRVTAVRAQDWSETYAYDSAGNLTHAEAPGDETAGSERTFAGNRLQRCGRHTYAYDEDGRLVRRTTRLLNGQTRTARFTWNTADQLTDAVLADGTHWTYEYDATGRRTVKRRLDGDGTAAEETRFVWDGTRLAEQVTSDGTATAWDYHSGTHRPLTQTVVSAGGRRDFHTVVTALSGAPTELITPDGQITWRLRTTVWGMPVGDGKARRPAIRAGSTPSTIRRGCWPGSPPPTASRRSPDDRRPNCHGPQRRAGRSRDS
ncbi:DUF6531 domain-containing protein [Streptomyces sp. NPDC048644]|uniref:DUF6531 domain-containing protein n=1 Tax=Streptomyces sp. NPDC048644 TaxID=3365582 RepID=UPI00371C6A09